MPPKAAKAAPAQQAPAAKAAKKHSGPKDPQKSKDKEEVPTHGPNGETLYPPKVPTPWNLTYKLDRKIDTFPDQQKILDAYPGSYVTKFPNMGKMDHPLIRYERIFLEQEALRNLYQAGVKNVMDVGGAVKRASSVVGAINKVEQKRVGSPTPVFVYNSCNPSLSAADAVRNLKHKDFLRKYADLAERVEWTTLQKSQNLSSMDGILWNHSLYYFVQLEVLEALLKTTLRRGLAITHTFDQSEGSFPGATYSKKLGKVVMNVDGNSFPYIHGDLEWLISTNAFTAMIDGSQYTLCWSVVQSGIYTNMYSFVVVDGEVPADFSKEPEKEKAIPEDVLKALHLTQQRPGPLGVFVWTQDNLTEFTVIPTLVKYAKDTCFMGKKPDEAAFRQAVGKMRSVEAEKILPQNVREAEWYSRAFTQSMVVAFLECAFEYNSAQEWVADLMPLLTKMGFGQCVKRELALSEKATNVILCAANAVKTVGAACGMDVVKDQYISDTVDVNMISPKKLPPLAKTLLSGIGSPPPAPPLPPVIPFGIAACPEKVQAEVDDRVATSKEACKQAKIARKDLVPGTKSYQDTLAMTTIKRFMSCKIRPNVFKRSATPWVFTRRLGPPLLPNTQSTASIASAKIHRLYDGKEHLDYAQHEKLKKSWADMRSEGYLPSAGDIAAQQAILPLATSRDWLFNQYGRRNDQKAVATYLKGIEDYEANGIIYYDYQFFVKKEAAMAKGNTNKFRGIFVVDPTYGSTVNRFYYQTMKILCKIYHPDAFGRSHTVVSAGLTAPLVGAAIGRAIEEHGNGLIIEMDASSFEANQTREHTECIVEFYKSFNPPQEIINAIMKMMDVTVIENVDPEGNRKISFFREGGMGSGIGDVSLRNSLNTIMARWSLLNSVGYSTAEIMDLTFAMVLGDDNWVAVPKDSRTVLITTEYVAKHFLDNHGWKMKCNVYDVDDYAKSEFCSMYPFQQVKLNGAIEWNMSLKPGRFFSKTLVTKVALERGMDTMQQLKGMVCGAGHFTNGWLMANCLNELYIRLNDIDMTGLNLDQDFDYQPTYKYGNGPISLPTDGSITEDCNRYNQSISDMRSALDHFKVCAKNFPKQPLIITAHPVWDNIIDLDVAADEEDFSDDLRLDPSMPDLKEVRCIPKDWYQKGATGYHPIYDDAGSSIFGLGLFQG